MQLLHLTLMRKHSEDQRAVKPLQWALRRSLEAIP
jgi:hypothetical protein